MLRVGKLSLYQFKNYSNKTFEFSKRIVGICGKNGIGKTNLLDALHYLCFTKSYFARNDASNVQDSRAGFRIEGSFNLNDEPEKVVCILRETGKKEFSVNDQLYEKFSQHIGRYPCVIIAPDDAVLITGGSEERRKFLDSLLSQLDPYYLQSLISYNKILQQRNYLLRAFSENGQRPGKMQRTPENFSLLDVLDEQLMEQGEIIFTRRRDFLVAFLPAVKHSYQEIAQQNEEVHLIYESDLLGSSFIDLIKAAREKDLLLQRSTVGIHKDDIDILFSNQPFKNIASQGQRKSLLFALKLTEMDVLKKEKKFAPLLLLDDVFEKLDEERIANLLNKVCIANDGQVFISDTNEERLREHLELIIPDFEIVELG